MSVLPVCIYALHVGAWCPPRSKEGICSPETGVTDDCKFPRGSWIKLKILWRAVNVPNCWAISLTMNLNFWYPCLKFLNAKIPCGEEKAQGHEVQSNCVLLIWASLCQGPHRLRRIGNGTAFFPVWVWILMVCTDNGHHSFLPLAWCLCLEGSSPVEAVPTEMS